ncbi:hypothetical protein [Falsiphaeobacter marinintestinus]|uniref:hypothetical protein n=1 Tax=Falsiphaeobacter marinintestinus TaxID=1492905 RepID=UPI0011B64E15|nr:hypothetical protein [Phaeobacter marinintestinus]
MFTSFSNFANYPVFSGAKARNTMLDWFFYDVGGLTAEERSELVRERDIEGSILVVWPKGERGDVSVRKFDDYEALRAASGDLVTRFTIAGVGSSDVGAAAFARTVANHFGCPVGAIVAGYGVADLLSEAMGGWFVLGGANRVLQMYQDAMDHQTADQAVEPQATLTERRKDAETAETGDDSIALVSLLTDKDRQIELICGHSKGCLSIASALDSLAQSGKTDAIERQKDMQIITAGAVVALPQVFRNVTQNLGELDWFGGMNSRLSLDYTTVPGAWHHLNTTLPGHLDFDEVLESAAL